MLKTEISQGANSKSAKRAGRKRKAAALRQTGRRPDRSFAAVRSDGGGWRVGEQAGPERREGSPDAVPIRADDEFVAAFHRVFGVS